MTADGKVNILLVDDQPGKLLSYETILANLGENLIKAASAREALEQLLKQDIAVVLVDVCMPELDGFQLAGMIRLQLGEFSAAVPGRSTSAASLRGGAGTPARIH